MGAFTNALKNADALSVIAALQNGGSYKFDLSGTEFNAVEEDVQIQYTVKAGFDMIMENNFIVLLDTTLTPELIEEGLLRELLSKVQNTRKTTGFDVNDTVKLYVEGDGEVTAMVHKFESYIKTEALATDVIYSVDGVEYSVEDINGHSTKIAVIRN